MQVADLIAFEQEVAAAFDRGEIHGPVHLSGGNEAKLISIFREVWPEDWVLSTWRSHYHALLRGIPRDLVMDEILAGRSMSLHFPEYKFLTSAMVGGILPIACGLAAEGGRVWCFVGDMCASTGAFLDACRYASVNGLDIRFVVEDNGLSTNTPTNLAWGPYRRNKANVRRYTYTRRWPHYQPLPSSKGF